ncbi:phosphotransferase [Celeribacter halophilus]|uniref:Phosphotransferase n=1 Tax=Celeribacter halophilus TaxID=576117 RepID=A0AAW7XUJ6_9RHOB|nr:phosphotransferase [Celeribacter halophilus]MDO6456934.1 phosphotransferase [Celeribacter halophilus]MDO6723596.1 phosphotransferase [Celeribacter halophilus]
MKHNPDEVPDALQAFATQNYGAPQEWKPLSGGRSNRSWRLRVGAEDRVFKLFDPARGNRLFPNEASAEASALKTLHGTGLAPEFVTSFETRQGMCLVYLYVEGERAATTDAALMRVLARLHSLKPITTLRRVCVTPERLLREGMDFLSGLATYEAGWLLRHMPEPEDIATGADVFLHGDPVPANVIAAGSERVLIDWQCPAYGDATADLAIALSPAMHVVYGMGPLTPEAEVKALQGYPDTETIARYRALESYYRWRMAAYCAWKAAQGEAIYTQALEAELNAMQDAP